MSVLKVSGTEVPAYFWGAIARSVALSLRLAAVPVNFNGGVLSFKGWGPNVIVIL